MKGSSVEIELRGKRSDQFESIKTSLEEERDAELSNDDVVEILMNNLFS